MSLTGLPAMQVETFVPTRNAGDLSDPHAAYGLLGVLISNMLNLAIYAGAIAALIFFFIGAFQWGTAGSGDGATKGRQTMIYATIGLVMLALVYVVIVVYNSIF